MTFQQVKSIIIDEIQKIPALLPLVHVLIEEKRGWKFILTGSNARKLKPNAAFLANKIWSGS